MEDKIRTEIVLIENKDLGLSYKRCPECNSRIKRNSVTNKEGVLKQLLKCRNKNCAWVKEYIFEV